MPPRKRVSTTSIAPRKRARVADPSGSASQPIVVNIQPSAPSPLPHPPSVEVLLEASQATTFESQLRDSRPEAEIVAPADGSEEATIASSNVADEAAERLDQNFEDNYDSIDWLRLPRFTKPLTTSRRKPSWIYQHGYRVVLLTDPEQVFWVCRYCHIHKYIDAGRGGVFPAAATAQAARHLCELRPGHSHQLPGKPRSVVNEGSIRSLFKSGVPVSQEVANELGHFDIQRFRLAAVGWLVDNNHPLSEFEKPAFRDMIAMANPEAEAALWQGHKSVRQYVLRLYNHLQPRVVYELSKALSRIHVSFDGWTTKGGKRGYLGIVAHYVNHEGNLVDLPIALPQLMGAHSGENMAEIVYSTLQKFGVSPRTIGYFVLDNASNNDTTIVSLAQKMGFNATYRRLRCGPHTLNIVGQTLLWGKDSDAYDNNVGEVVAVDTEHKFMSEWRSDGPLGVLLAIINSIKTPQQYELFTNFQQLAHHELPIDATEDDRKILEPIKPVITRWNSFYSCFERAAKLQSAVNAYANHHINDTRQKDDRALRLGNKPPFAPPWMRSDGLTAADWAVITEYIDVLGPLKTATKRLEGHGKSGSFGSIAEIIPVFEVLLSKFEEKLQNYDAVDHCQHNEAPEDHLAINLRAALVKARSYYSKLDHSPAYYTATILHPRYKSFCDSVWAEKPEWLSLNNRNFYALWAEYNTTPKPQARLQKLSNDLDDAIDSLCNPKRAPNNIDENEYTRWKTCEPVAEKDSPNALNPTQYWMGLREQYPNLSRLALDILSIPASSCECERMFSELGDLLEPRRRNISPQLLAAIQCVRRWKRAGLSDNQAAEKSTITDKR